MTVGERYVEGEDPSSKKPGDARHWVALYGEMIDFKNQLLQRMSRRLPGLSKGARKALDADVRLMQSQRSRYQRRLKFWSERQADLAGLKVDDATMTLTFGNRRAALTGHEFEVISVLLSRPGAAFTEDALLRDSSKDDPESTSETVQMIIGQLGNKLLDLGAPCEVISVPGRGYAVVFHE